MGKKVFVIFLVILLLSSSVYAYSFPEFLEDFNEFVTGKVVGREVVRDECESKFLDEYVCKDNGLLRIYQKSDCSKVSLYFKDCEFGCSNGNVINVIGGALEDSYEFRVYTLSVVPEVEEEGE